MSAIFFKIVPADYNNSKFNKQLSIGEKGVFYHLFLIMAWADGGKLMDNDELNAEMAGISIAQWIKTKEKFLELAIIRSEGGFLTHADMIQKHWKAVRYSETQSNNRNAKQIKEAKEAEKLLADAMRPPVPMH